MSEGNYPQYAELFARARLEAPRFVSPQATQTYRSLISTRGHDWCTSVLGRAFPGLNRISVIEAHLLVLADAAGLTPPLPEAVVVSRRVRAEMEERLAARHRELRAADVRRWEAACAGLVVDLVVCANMNGFRHTGTGLDAGPLRHAVPTTALWSGSTTRPRAHPAGRAVCETVTRAKPRVLQDPSPEPATCRSCLNLVPRLRSQP